MGWKQTLQEPKQVEIDSDARNEGCCQAAKNQVLEVFNSTVQRYREAGRDEDAVKAEKNFDIMDGLGCDEFKIQLHRLAKLDRYPKLYMISKPMKFNPEVVKLREIYEEWLRCEK